MSEKTGISWCDSTVNFWIGCTKVLDQNGKLTDSGCKECYAAEQDGRRYSRTLGGGTKENPIRHFGPGKPRYKVQGAVQAALAMNAKPWICGRCGHSAQMPEYHSCNGFPMSDLSPISWHRRRIFSLSLGDIWDNEIKVEWRAEGLHMIWKCDDCIWILCSKRWEKWRNCIEEILNWQMATGYGSYEEGFFEWLEAWLDCVDMPERGDIPSNIIGLCSVENQAMADKRLPQFLTVPLACRGLSLEPLLSPVNLSHKANKGPANVSWIEGIDWAIIGCESGHNRRDCDNAWVENLVEQCRAAEVATFVKQVLVNGQVAKDIKQFPARLQIQEFPKGF